MNPNNNNNPNAYQSRVAPIRKQVPVDPRASDGLRMAGQFSQQAQEAGRNRRTGVRLRRRKYSLVLLDEGVKRAAEIGVQRASEELGIGFESLRKHAFARRLEAMPQGQAIALHKKLKSSKYTVAQKQEVVRKAEEIHRTTGIPITRAYESAGRLLGVNGASVRMQLVRGLFTMET